MTFIKIVILGSLTFLLNTLAYPVIAASLSQEIKQQIHADLSKIYPKAIINIDFNQPNTNINNSKCREFKLSPVKTLPTGGRTSLRITCKHPKWSTYISLKISIIYLVASAKVPLFKGETLTVDNIHFQPTDITKLYRAYFTRPDTILGKVAKRTIKSQQVIGPHMLDLPTLITKGDSVIIEAGANGLTISTLGTALQSGKKGRQIRIKNIRSGKVIRAYVIAKGRVSTNPNK